MGKYSEKRKATEKDSDDNSGVFFGGHRVFEMLTCILVKMQQNKATKNHPLCRFNTKDKSTQLALGDRFVECRALDY